MLIILLFLLILYQYHCIDNNIPFILLIVEMLDFLGKGHIQAKDVQKAIVQLPLKQKIKALAIYKRYKQILVLQQAKEKVIRDIEKQYIKKDDPILLNISQLVKGSRPIRPDQVREPQLYLTEEEIKQIPEHLNCKKIQGYWGKCLKASSMLKNAMGTEDEPLIQCIENITVVDEENTDNFTAVFEMGPNEFISNKVLTKRFVLNEEGEPIKTQASPIEWVGKNITMKEIKKKQKNKKTGQNRIVTRTVEAKSFFNLFKSIERVPGDDLDEKTAKQNEQIDNDFQIIGVIVDEIIPYSIEYYLGIQHQGDDYDDQDDLQGEQEDSEEDEPKKKKKKNNNQKSKSKSKSKSKDKPAEVPPQQCKTQ